MRSRFAELGKSNFYLGGALCVLLAGVGWYGYSLVEQAIKQSLAAELSTSLNSTVQALRMWHREKQTTVAVWAAERETRENILLLVQKAKQLSAQELLRSKELNALRRKLEPVVRKKDYVGFVVFDTEGRQVGALLDQPVGQTALAEKSDFVARSLLGETVVSLPFLAEIELPSGPNNKWTQARLTMFAAAPVYDANGVVSAVLAFRFRPEQEFGRILESGRYGKTGETYAFDGRGRLISPSRFVEQISQIKGWPFGGGATDPLFDLRDPGGDLLAGYRPTAPRGQWPLTRMASSAVAKQPGVDTDGYRDYRGVPVVGAWAWLDEFGFGVTTEIDVDEAFAPLIVFRKENYFLFGLLFCATVMALVLQRWGKKAHEEAERQREFAESIVNCSGDGIFAVDRDCRITVWNPGMENLTGVRREDVLGRGCDTAPPAIKNVCDQETVLQVLRGESALTHEQEFPGPAAESKFFEIRCSPILGAQNRINGALGILRDITERKKTEKQLQTAHTAALQSERVKSEFLSIMSHELRTPLNAILGMGQLLEESPLTPTQLDFVRILLRSGESLTQLIGDILDFSKLETGKITIDPAPFDLVDLVERISITLSARAREKQLELVFYIDHNVSNRLVGDAHWLRQVLLNLIGNAIKFTDRGEVVVRVEKDPARAEPGAVRFSISDTGIGIAPDKIPIIFDKFSLGDSSDARRFGGTGLGLAICKKLVELMGGGAIQVESQLGVGSRFAFTLPFNIRVSPLEWPQPSAPNLPTGARILIVDDNSANRLVLAEILKSWHIETVQADSSQSGAEQVRRAVEQGQPFQAALIDNLMPGGSGFDLVQSLGDQCPPAVLLCSELMREDAVRMRDLGIESWLLKPVRRSELYHILISILGKPRPSAEDKATEAPQEIPILLAEDSAENRALFGYFLKGSGYNPDLAENGLVAVRKFQENQYHMVFMDMQMPELDGYSAILKIREFESANQRRRTPVIALTAFARAEEIAKGFAAGCDFHLAKPIKKTELLATIRRFLPAALRPPVPAEADLPPRSADSAAE